MEGLFTFALVDRLRLFEEEGGLDRLGNALAELFGEVELAPCEGQARCAVLRLNGADFVLMGMDFPVPQEDLAAALSLERMWPEAKTEIQQARAHYVVGVGKGAEDLLESVSQARMLTVLSHVVCRLNGCRGVLWVPGRRLLSPALLEESADEALSGVPFVSWSNLSLLRGPDGPDGRPTTGVVTFGLQPFLGRELELFPVPLDPRSAADLVYRIMGGVLVQGLRLRPGEVLRDGERLAVEVTAGESTQVRGLPVYQLRPVA